ncbi:Putative ATP:guanido phosphotransferase SAV0524 [Urinicoccus massiliensis]|uniref:ATP:guanido phosphotransferase SAV0524 n=1 Tax=Urinicoccus massiliensis TaxID=1723382 RepID=A0A8H2R0J8_9FIRM|nr:ATP--guanido phosphotransferase [Urinicoccus massiliensis]VFB15748.1 Putative ATP:guanido phosphotransferase SAV0524 [Urinicoccus massiliensis]
MNPIKDDKTHIILTSRIRLARNLKDYPFTEVLNPDQEEEITKKVHDAIDSWPDTYTFYPLKQVSLLSRLHFVEQQWISPGMMERTDGASFFLREDKEVSIMVLEEDHLRLQAILPGLALEEAYQGLLQVERDLDKDLDFAYDCQYGYLTACPTNVGTGLRASVMVHLPALEISGLKSLKQSLTKMGLVLRGFHGEGSKSVGGIYQVSNEQTLGFTEQDYIRRLEKAVLEIVALEEAKRKELYFQEKIKLEDKVCRSFGILRNARILSYEEMCHCLSMIRLGIDLSIIKQENQLDIYETIFRLQNASLQIQKQARLDQESRDIYRADLCRRMMKEGF